MTNVLSLMKQSADKYILNFVISIGPTGSQGNQGPTGPATLEDAIFVQYHNSFTQGLLIPFSNIVVPSSSSLSSIKNNEVVINEPGNYEYTLCGNLSGNTIISI